MESFIKKLFENKADEACHAQFTRFGKGTYPGRAAIAFQKSANLKLKGSYEYANDFVNLVLDLGPAKFSGIIMSREDLGFDNCKKKPGVFVYEVENVDHNKIKEIFPKSYCLLLDAIGPGIDLKTKKKLPKPGKSGDAKIDDGFTVLNTDLKNLHKIKEAFLWDTPDCKKCKAKHVYEITNLIMPKDEKDFEKIRLMTKRKGKIKRILEIDGKEEVKEKEFEA